MKSSTLMTIVALTAALSVVSPILSQTPAPGGRGKGKWKQAQQQRLAALTPDERKKVQAARRKAKEDPAVKAAREKVEQAAKEFQAAMEAAMLKDDPSLKPILDKIPKPSPPPEP